MNGGAEVTVTVPSEGYTWFRGVSQDFEVWASAGPPGGTYTWSEASEQEGVSYDPKSTAEDHTVLTATEPGVYVPKVTYAGTWQGQAYSVSDTGGDLVVIEADIQIGEEDQPDYVADESEEDPGAFVGVNGPRLKLTLVLTPLEAEGLVYHEAHLHVYSNKVKLYDLAEGGQELGAADLTWDDFETPPCPVGRQNWHLRKTEVWVQGVEASAAPRDVTITLTYSVWDKDYALGAQHADTVKFTVVGEPVVRIKQDGRDITDTTHDEIVGKKINLTAQVVLPAGYTFEEGEWTNLNWVWKDYVTTEAEGTTVELSQADREEQAISYYWFNWIEGDDVTYTATVDGDQYSGEATFVVKRPTVVLTATEPAPDISTLNDPRRFRLGSLISGGIAFVASDLVIPEGFSGETAFVQYYYRRYRNGDGETWDPWVEQEGLDPTRDSNDEYVDWRFEYSPVGQPVFQADDTASYPLEDYRIEVRDGDGDNPGQRITMWYMFKPTGEDSIFVPLAWIRWQWGGIAHRWEAEEKVPSQQLNIQGASTLVFPHWHSLIPVWG